MSEEKHLFHIQSAWTGNSDGDGALTGDWDGEIAYGVPPQLGGKSGRVSPEDLLISAVVSCYSITLALLLEKRRLNAPRIEVDVEGEVVRLPDRTLKFQAIRLRPKVTLADADDAQRQTALDCAHKADRYCPISNAVRGSVELIVEPEILTN